MGETELRGNILQGDGVYKSTDGGKTWTHVGLEKTQAIARIRIHPTNPDIVYVAALGDPYGPNPERGIFKSTDGGKTWTKVAVPRRQDRRRRSDDGSEEPRRAVRGPLGGVPHAALAVERRARAAACSRPPTAAAPGPRSPRTPGCRSRSGARSASRSPAPTRNRVYAIIEAAEGGVFLSDDAGATLEAGQRRPPAAAARVLLHAHLRRPAGQGHRSTS